ncbi:MAG: cytochrome c oxidase accessory protein CcoG, partial [Rhodospirillales bacterium]|nr:cytochrome c oxidase accessory protein CcoG [Rhodospirillales bacterium]
MNELVSDSRAPGPAADVPLYETRKKIHVRAVTGRFAGWRWALVFFTQAIFYGLPWLSWNDRQALLFDIVGRKFYLFGVVLWPQDVIYLALLLIASACALFLFTAIGGRLFCGYACPQTVYSEIFIWIEQKIEGDRAARIRLDRQPMSPRKLALKTSKHAVWLLFALWTGFTFVGYFTPIKMLAAEVATWTLSGWETFWIAFYGLLTYGNAGWMREQVCKYMCPYARFQAVMFDPDTLIVTYDPARGEPRGARAKRVDYRAAGLGACVDCGICVQVCPTGIDIRDGLQSDCIGCSACIDGCDQVMDKLGYARGLIRYSTENALKHHWGSKEIVRRVLRPRILVYGAVLAAIVAATVFALATRQPLKVDVLRDRALLAREGDNGMIENSYRLQIMNISEAPQRYAIRVAGLPGIEIEHARIVHVPPAESQMVPIEVR